MELDVAFVMGAVIIVVSFVSLKAFKSYNSIEQIKAKNNQEHQATTLIYQNTIKDLENSNRNYVYKIRKIRDTYELDYDGIEYKEEEDDEFRLSELAKSIYPKLPDSLGKLIDKEEFQNAILKTAEKNPDIITKFVDKFLNKTDKPTEGSQTNTSTFYYN